MRPVLLDTTIWVKVFRKTPGVTGDALRLFRTGLAVVHPWTIVELMLGDGVPPAYLRALHGAPTFPNVGDDGAKAMLRDHDLQRSGIGLVDLHILATAHRNNVALWTTDGALARAALAVGLPEVRPDDLGPT